MGILTRIAGRRTYLDVNVFIYALEAHPTYLAVVSELFAAIDGGKVYAVTSELSLAESLVKPYTDGRADLQAVYTNAIAPAPFLDVVQVSREILINAARIPATRGIRLPDAIHLATAGLSQCGVFLTNDRGIPSSDGLEVLRLADFIANE
jgi:predicted nucleic acid-binding protein